MRSSKKATAMPHNDPLPPALSAFLYGEIDAVMFRHADHVHAAFEILQRHSFLDAATAYATALKGIATRAGNPDAYHETITLAFLSLIAERMSGRDYDTFAAFVAGNSDLMEKSVLQRWYTPERLQSAVARATFILPGPVQP